MALFFEILAGDMKGTRTPVVTGLTIGRKACLLTIRDSKLSSRHAVVENRDGTFWLKDLGSANGIKSGESRLREVKLEPGLSFTLGRTPFQIISTEDAVDDVPTAVAAVTVTRTFWDTILDLTARAAGESKAVPRKVAPFNPVVRLTFIRGIQTGTEWTIGYGPRMIGTSSLDLALEDTTLPPICFRLEPQHSGILFKNETERECRLNGKWVRSELLKDGDVIEIVNTQIQVSFEYGL